MPARVWARLGVGIAKRRGASAESSPAKGAVGRSACMELSYQARLYRQVKGGLLPTRATNHDPTPCNLWFPWDVNAVVARCPGLCRKGRTMAPRTTWKGLLTLARVSCPVRVHPAV